MPSSRHADSMISLGGRRRNRETGLNLCVVDAVHRHGFSRSISCFVHELVQPARMGQVQRQPKKGSQANADRIKLFPLLKEGIDEEWNGVSVGLCWSECPGLLDLQTQGFLNNCKGFFRLTGLSNKKRNPASSAQGTGLRLQKGRTVEDHRDIFQQRMLAEGRNELVAIHGRHQDVGDDEVRLSEPCLSQSLFTIARFNHLMPGGRQQGYVELASIFIIIDD